MKCPHCGTNLKRKERGGKVCSSCKREFAFDPKSDSFQLNDVRFRKAIAAISGDGKYFYTPKQLLYFLSRKKIKSWYEDEATRQPTLKNFLLVFLSSFLFCGMPLLMFPVVSQKSEGGKISDVIADVVAEQPLLLFAAVVVTIVISVWFWFDSKKNCLPVSFEQFEADVLGRWQQIYNAKRVKMIADDALYSTVRRQRKVKGARGVLVCADNDVNLCLLANRVDEKLKLILINPTAPLPALGKDKLELALKRKELPVFVLHDASAEGCLLAENVACELFGAEDRSRIFDIGLRPRKTMNSQAISLRDKLNKDLPTSLERHLSSDEINWLKNGYYTPLVALTPAQLIAYVTKAVAHNTKLHEQTKEATAKLEAEEIGFMTWIGH